MDRDRYRFQKFVSDIAGQDIKSHGNSPEAAVRAVCDWLRNVPGAARSLPGGPHLWAKYQKFTKRLAAMSAKVHLTPELLTFTDFYQLALEGLSATR